MAEIGQKEWNKGDLLMCRGLLAILVDIQDSPLGFHMYRVQFVDSGDVNVVSKHLLHEIEVVDAFLDDEQWDTGTVCASDVSPVGYTCTGPLLNIADEDSCTIVASTCNDVAGIAATSTDVAGVASTSRHCHLTEEEIDSVAQSRLSTHTDNQTRWAVRLFKG